MKSFSICTVLALCLFSCKDADAPITAELYFPPIASENWETTSPSSLNWNSDRLHELYDVLEEGDTRGFIILKEGKIVIEKYFGSQIIGTQNFDKNSIWYWASAGKTLTATLTGIAQQEGLLAVDEPSSKYLGEGWTSLHPEQEQKITIWHQLTMTTGLDDGVDNNADFSPENLVFKTEPGTRWAYHNAPYTILDKVIAQASGESFGAYFESKIASRIGMIGQWQTIGFNNVYFSNTRSAARYGLLILANGFWEGRKVLDQDFLNQMTQSSQTMNKSYGYLFWLNGKESYMVPTLQTGFSGPIIPNAPSDLVAGLGRDGQFVCIVPSQNLVLIRLGLDPSDALVSFQYLDTIWQKLNLAMPN
ncbi:serine hydrolase domain-containing protein [Belliella marina]|uniref:Serine hydrolase domain-containing protein n=1 Tax=Belliella marina TaxID=1644146 RepID=A0ABW4VR27_9BACT